MKRKKSGINEPTAPISDTQRAQSEMRKHLYKRIRCRQWTNEKKKKKNAEEKKKHTQPTSDKKKTHSAERP